MSNSTWENIAHNVDRIEVPGGWIYTFEGPDNSHTQAAVFVPTPKDYYSGVTGE